MKKAFALLLVSTSACAYEVETHGLLTLEAFKISVLNPTSPSPNQPYERLGFDRIDARNPYLQPDLSACQSTGTDPKQDAYIDAVGAWLIGSAGRADPARRKQ